MILSDLATHRPGPVRMGIALAVVAAMVVAACGDDDSDGSADSGAEVTDGVIATTSIWADVTSAVGCGVPIASLVPAGADPHTFEPSLRDRELIERSTTVISNGLDLEESLTDLLDAATDAGVDVIEMADHVDVITDDAGHDDHDDDDHDDHDDDESHDDLDDDDHDDDEDHQGHDHGDGGDPHIWQDPTRVAVTLDAIASALAAHDIDTCVDEYREELLALDGEIEAMLEAVPTPERVLVTSHQSLAYFADRYDFEVVGTVIPSTSTLAETNAADLAHLAETIEAHDVPAIFTAELESTPDADALADRLGVGVVDLVTDSLTDDPDSDTYLEMMRSNATAIAAALTP